MFRTPTGQTGNDAYVFEATAIANAQRELDARMKRLVDIIREEDPEGDGFYTRNLHRPRATDAGGLSQRLLTRPTVQIPVRYRDLTWDGLDASRPDLAQAIADGAKPIYI